MMLGIDFRGCEKCRQPDRIDGDWFLISGREGWWHRDCMPCLAPPCGENPWALHTCGRELSSEGKK